MTWWTKVAYFTTADLALLGLINAYFGDSITIIQRISILITGLALIPIVVILSWYYARIVDSARRKAVETQVKVIQSFDQGLMEGLRTSRNDPIKIAQAWVREQLSGIAIVDWVPVISRPINDEKIITGTAIAQSGQLYGYEVRLTSNNEVIPIYSSVWEGERPA